MKLPALILAALISISAVVAMAKAPKPQPPKPKQLSGSHEEMFSVEGFILCKPPMYWKHDASDCVQLPHGARLILVFPDSASVPDTST